MKFFGRDGDWIVQLYPPEHRTLYPHELVVGDYVELASSDAAERDDWSGMSLYRIEARAHGVNSETNSLEVTYCVTDQYSWDLWLEKHTG